LDWNEPAITFYRKLGGRMLDDWRIFRVTGNALDELSRQSTAAGSTSLEVVQAEPHLSVEGDLVLLSITDNSDKPFDSL
jgi:hypothetical protein